MSRPGVFLDRDGRLNGTIIRSSRPCPPQTLAELRVLPGVTDACRGMCAVGLVANLPLA